MAIFPSSNLLDIGIRTSLTAPLSFGVIGIARLPDDVIYNAPVTYTNFVAGTAYRTTYDDNGTLISDGTITTDFTLATVAANSIPEVISTVSRKYQYLQYDATIAHNRSGSIIYGAQLVDNNVTENNEATVAAYVGYSYDALTSSFTIPALETINKAYDYGVYSASLLENITSVYPLSTVAGTNYTIANGWTLKLFDDLGGVNLSGNVELQTVTDLTSLHVNGRVTFTAAGTYALDNTTITEVINTSAGNITVSLLNGSSITTNLSPATITILEPQQVTFTDLIPDSDVVILAAGTNTVLASVDQEPATTWSFSNNSAIAIDIGINKTGYKPLYIYNYQLNLATAQYPISQIKDRNYK